MILKRIVKLVLLSCFLGNYAYGQRITIKSIESRLITHQGAEFIGELKDKNKDLYSFSNWSNEGVLYVGNKKYSLSNINFNVSTNSFDSRIDRERLFSYRNSTLDSVIINDHLFKRVRNSFYEVLCEKGNNQLLKLHSLKYHEGSVNRLSGTVGESKRTLTFKYLIKFEGEFKKIELNKKSILSLLKNKDLLVKFVKKQNLSYKKEKDVVRILSFIFDNENKLTNI